VANTDHTIDILFKGSDQVSSTIDSVAGGLDRFAGGVGNIAAPFAAAGDAVAKLNALIATGTVGAITAATLQSNKFKDQMREINTLTQLDDSGFSAFSDDVLKAAQDLKGADIGGLQTALYNAVSLGVSDYTDALAAATQAEKLAIGGKADLNDSLEFLIGTMNAYGADVDEAGRYSDAFFTIVRDGKTTIPELASSMSDVTGIAAAGQVPIETLGAAIAAITATGTPTSQAITKIKSALEGIINPTDEAKKVAAELGIELSASALKSKGFEGVLKEIQNATGGNVETMTKLFTSTEGLQAALALGADKSGVFAKSLEDMQNKAGATEKAFNEMADNSDLAFQKMTNNLKVLLIKAGQEMDGLGTAVIEPLTGLFQTLADEIDAGTFAPLFDKFNEFSGDAISAFSDVVRALPEALDSVDFGGLLDSLDDIKDAFGDMFDGLDLHNADGLSKAIQTAVDAVAGLIKVGGGMVEAWTPVVEMVGSLVKWFAELGSSSQGAIGNFLGITQQATIVATGIGGISLALSGVSDLLLKSSDKKKYDAWRSSVDNVADGAGGLSGKFASLGKVLGVVGAGFAGWEIGTAIREAVPQIDDATQGMLGWVDSIVGFSGTQGRANETIDETVARIREEIEAAKKIREEVKNIPEEKAIDVTLDDGSAQDGLSDLTRQLDDAGVLVINPELETNAVDEELTRFFDQIDNPSIGLSTEEFKAQLDTIKELIPKREVIDIEPVIDERAHEYARGYLEDIAPDGTRTFTWVGELDKPSIDEAKKAVEDAIPPEKKLKIQTELEIAQLEADSKKIESMLDYKARVDIAEIEAAAEQITAAFSSIDAALASTGDVISSLFGSLNDFMGTDINSSQIRNAILKQLEKENEYREKTLKLQEGLTKAQIEYMNARRSALDSGQPLITVQANNLAPALEMIFINILELCQVRANEEGLEALVGL